ncbi:MAG: hypothetical protein H6727_06895 [Myxococcales bacterium]|nr:hypothetical protein [Myxococcales bacterium]
MQSAQDLIDLVYTDHFSEAMALSALGYEPVECAYGGNGSVLGDLAMDHHGAESWREGVALRACRDHYGARKKDPRFVVTGTPDADAVLAVIALSGLVPASQIPQAFYELVNLHDVDPVPLDLLSMPYGEELLYFQQLERLRRDRPSFFRAIDEMRRLLLGGLQPKQRTTIRRREEHRIQMAEESFLEHIGERVLLVESRVWGFDRWYRKAPFVVSYSQRASSITIGCRSMVVAEQMLGEGGLLRVFPQMGHGWGGRESIGGSPRGVVFSFDQAREVAEKLEVLLG